MTSIFKWRWVLPWVLFGLVAMLGGTARAADVCMDPGQILVPSGNGGASCLAGSFGSSGCPLPITVITASGGLTCIAGPTCPAGYSKGLPPVIGSPNNMAIDTRVCQAVCSSVFTTHGWPCSCPYGQHVNAASGQCVATCGPSATWQHTPGKKWQGTESTSNDTGTELYVDPGVCTCPSGQEYVTGLSACMKPCPEGQIHDGSGKCYTPSTGTGGTKTNYCIDGQGVGYCICPSGGVVKDGKCFICSVKTPSGACQSSPQPTGDSDYNHPSNLFSPQTCTAGTHWNGLKCVVNQPSTPNCASGLHWNGSTCVSNVTLTGFCPAGSHWDGTKCTALVVMPMRVCTRDQHWDGRTCVANGCSMREHWDGQRCVAN